MGLFDFLKDKESAKVESYWDDIKGDIFVENIYTEKNRASGIFSMSISNDGNKLVAGVGFSDKIIFINIASKNIKSINANQIVTAIQFSHDDRYIVWGSSDRNINVFDVANHKIVHNEPFHADEVADIKISPNDKYLAAVSEDGLILEHFLGQFIFESYNDHIYSIAFSPDEKFMLLGNQNNILFFDLSNTQQLNHYYKQNVASLMYTKLENIFAPIKYGGHNANISSIVFSPSGKTFLSGDKGGNIILWDTKRKTILKKFAQTPLPINSLSFSKDGYYFLSANGDTRLNEQANSNSMVKLWNIDKKEPILELKEHKNAVVFAGFDKDNNIISASTDGSIKKITIK